MTDLINRADAALAILQNYTETAQLEALNAIPAVTPPPAQVRVKPLVWEIVPTGYGPETYQAYAATGFYQVFTDEDSSSGAVFAEFATDETQFGMIYARSIARVNGFIEAKAAAQADYAARILAAIETTPDPRDAVIARLVEALTPSGGTKAAYMGEIKDPDTNRMVSWTAIKIIMAIISARAAIKDDQQ